MDSTPLESHLQPAFIDELPRRLSEALASAPACGFLSLTLPVRDFRGSPGLPAEGPAVWWGRPGEQRFRAGTGIAWEQAANGEGRFVRLGAEWRRLRAGWRALGLDGAPATRAAFLGFAFSPDAADPQLPNAMLCVPRAVVERRGNTTLMHFNGAPGDEADELVTAWSEAARQLVAAAWQGTPATDAAPQAAAPGLPADDPAWDERVRVALAAIAGLPLEKLVLTRRLQLALEQAPAVNRVLERLAARYPEAAVYAVQRDGTSLVGASPERLLGLEHGLVVADALAGSAPRATCDDADQQLGGQLLGDPKERAEHEVVVREILAALEPLCTALMASHAPSLLRLSNVQHLASHVHGRVRPEVGVFELLERMHPTPAVGGAPRAAALAWLREHGEANRGWYTGGVGWLDDAGGDVWVALRCALLEGRRASLYAGAGIVAGSRPEQELRETGWKLQAMLEALAVD
ncbi:isochorismate synthase [Thioalkalivibrio sp. XN8]|uniref:isochorismate synthase n=1 Tax=Thioalkalivibrio sp. XN8 TaxID=2712863 RepID=UPI0013E9D17C|nr:isochorismate synthase [Thioalkalivibrio sp. XN8]